MHRGGQRRNGPKYPVPTSPHPSSIVEASQEMAQIDRAILQGAVRILNEFGGLQAVLKRSIALKKQARRGLIQRSDTWQRSRLSEAHFI